MLERYEVKVSRTVLRRERGSDAPDLADKRLNKIAKEMEFNSTNIAKIKPLNKILTEEWEKLKELLKKPL